MARLIGYTCCFPGLTAQSPQIQLQPNALSLTHLGFRALTRSAGPQVLSSGADQADKGS